MPSRRTVYLSPLRYPGGKSRLARFVGDLIASQQRRALRYVEPFAGGAGVGLRLLFDERVDEIVINDLNRGIAAFWRALFTANADLVALVRACKPSVREWHHQRERYESGPDDDLALGFATFFLNRTNRSGILGARPIGGLDQSGAWKIDARYDANALAERIKLLGPYSSRVTVCEEDGVALIQRVVGDAETFIYADPPYLTQGDDLYLDTFEWKNHERLARVLRSARRWLLTYDADPRVHTLYPGLRCASFGIAHTAATQHVGREYAVFSKELSVTSLANLSRHGDAMFTA